MTHDGPAITSAPAPARPAAAGPGPVLDVRDLRIVRARPSGPDTIVSSVTLSLGAGETIGIVGESGSGKSMTARAITGQSVPTSDTGWLSAPESVGADLANG